MTVVTYISMSVLMSNVLCFILQTDRLNHGRMQLILRQLRLQQSSFLLSLNVVTYQTYLPTYGAKPWKKGYNKRVNIAETSGNGAISASA